MKYFFILSLLFTLQASAKDQVGIHNTDNKYLTLEGCDSNKVHPQQCKNFPNASTVSLLETPHLQRGQQKDNTSGGK